MFVVKRPTGYAESNCRISLANLSNVPTPPYSLLVPCVLKFFQYETGVFPFLSLSVTQIRKKCHESSDRLLPLDDTRVGAPKSLSNSESFLRPGWQVTFFKDAFMLTDLDLISHFEFILCRLFEHISIQIVPDL